jgi:RNA polymerase sigma factor (sigma-70 family)
MARAAQVEEWVQVYGREIHAYLWRLLGNSQDAEDCLQETYVRALRSRSGQVRAPRPWLYAIATNTARSMLRRRRRREDRQVDLDEDLTADPGEDSSIAERVADVRAAVDRLPRRQKEALLLRRYQGMAYDEIGRILECTPAAARANVYQALRKLRAIFPEEAR